MSAPFARERAVQIYVPDAPAGDPNVGSGYLLDARRILTVAHVAGHMGATCQVRPLGAGASLDAAVVWISDAGADLAVLELTRPAQLEVAAAPVAFGRVAGSERVACRSLGFPEAQVRSDPQGEYRDSESVHGQIDPLTTLKTDHLTIHIAGSAPVERGGDLSWWAGMSGAAVFCGDLLVGAISVDPDRFAPDRLLASPIASVAHKADLAAVLDRQAPLALEPVVGTPTGVAAPAGPSRAHPLVRLPFSRNADFLGRHEALNTLAATLADETAAITGQSQALAGLGGVGKTQLALEHAYRALEERRIALAWWVRAEELAFLVADLAELAEQLGLARPESERTEAAQTALRWLRAARDPWLLIYDNASDPDVLRHWLPGGGPGQVLITSRQPDWAGLASSVEVDVFDTSTATDFLLQRTGRTEREGGEILAIRLGGLALALEQAAAYALQTGRSFAEYVSRLEKNGALLARPSGSAQYEGTVAAVVAESRDAARGRTPVAGELLDLIAYLDPEAIPLWLLEAGEGRPGFSADVLDEAVSALAAYSLLRVEAGGLSVHRLVQEVTRSATRGESAALGALGLVASRFPRPASELANWAICAALVPHVPAVTFSWAAPDRGRRPRWFRRRSPFPIVVNGQAMTPALATTYLLNGAATYTQYRGDPSGAVPLFRRGLSVAQALLGEKDPNTWALAMNLANALEAAGDLHAALRIQEEALAPQQLILGDEHPQVLVARSNLGSMLRRLGDLPGARAMHENVFAVRQTILGEDAPATLLSQHHLGITLVQLGEYAAARAVLEEVVARRRQILGPEHPDTLTSLEGFGVMLNRSGDLGAARAVEEKALEVRTRVLGPNHPDTLRSMSNLGATRWREGDISALRDLVEPALEGQRRVLGRNHYDTITTLGNLAEMHQERGDLSMARGLQEEVLDATEELLGPRHPDTIRAVRDLAVTLSLLGDPNATSLLSEVLERASGVLDDESPLVSDAKCRLSSEG